MLFFLLKGKKSLDISCIFQREQVRQWTALQFLSVRGIRSSLQFDLWCTPWYRNPTRFDSSGLLDSTDSFSLFDSIDSYILYHLTQIPFIQIFYIKCKQFRVWQPYRRWRKIENIKMYKFYDFKYKYSWGVLTRGIVSGVEALCSLQRSHTSCHTDHTGLQVWKNQSIKERHHTSYPFNTVEWSEISEYPFSHMF